MMHTDNITVLYSTVRSTWHTYDDDSGELMVGAEQLRLNGYLLCQLSCGGQHQDEWLAAVPLLSDMQLMEDVKIGMEQGQVKTRQSSIGLCCSHCTVLYCTVTLTRTVLYCTVLYCTVLYCTVLYCTVLYCTVT